MFSKATFLAMVLLGCIPLGCGEARVEPAALDPQFQSELNDWLAEHGKPPVDYVVSLFADHDVVFLGEWHRIKHDPEFIQSLLAPLYAAGVRTLATEFARREDQALVDSVTTDPQWHEDLARRITFNSLVTWGYREYVDVFRAAWEINRGRAGNAPRFQVLALGDSPDWSLIAKPEDRDDPEVMRRVWRGGGEEHWAQVILDVVNAGQKVLVYSGIHHAFTEYLQPIVVDGRFVRFEETRAGNYVFRAIGKRAVTVFLHAPWPGSGGYNTEVVHPADGVLDAFMLSREGGPYGVGFSLTDSPFGRLPIRNAVYQHGYDDGFTPVRFADGWIYTKPIAEYTGVIAIPDWIDETNIEHAQRQMPNPEFRTASIRRFNSVIARAADIPHRLAHLR
jgi:hypothetical protein